MPSMSLEMSLDDIIKTKPKTQRKSDGEGGGRGGRGGRGGSRGGRGGAQQGGRGNNPLARSNEDNSYAPRRNDNRGGGARNNAAPYSRPVQQSREIQVKRKPAASKVLVTNLDSVVTEDNLRTIFRTVGHIVRISLNYNAQGRPAGSAEVFFGGKGDAETAVSEYHEAEVDGRAMFITAMPVTPEDNMDVFSSKNSMFGSAIQDNRAPRREERFPREERQPRREKPQQQQAPRERQQQQQKPARGAKAGARGGRGGAGGRGGKRESAPAKSAEDLDAEMDAYMSAGAPAAEATAE